MSLSVSRGERFEDSTVFFGKNLTRNYTHLKRYENNGNRAAIENSDLVATDLATPRGGVEGVGSGGMEKGRGRTRQED